jgi:acetyl-CoA C-acetyltransferase
MPTSASETRNRIVVAGVAEIVERPGGGDTPRHPAQLIADACRAACADARIAPRSIDHVSVVNVISWRYADLPATVTGALGIDASAEYGAPGGETPLRFLHRAASRISAGQSRVEIVCGGEASYSARLASDPVAAFGWPERPPPVEAPFRPYLNPLAHRLGVVDPVVVYPLYENARLAWEGLAPEEAQRRSAALWAGLSRVAADNAYAWLRQPLSPDEIATVTESNRMIAWPYTKSMVANPQVNQAAAFVVMSEADARAATLPVERMVTLAFAAEAMEPRDYLARDDFHRSPAMEAVLGAARADLDGRQPDHVELYSCFPCVPKMACAVLDRNAALPISVTGGLSFFGGPFNNYMSHAVAAMVRRLRAAPDQHGLLYGQGEFVTKHFAVRLAGGARGDPGAFEADASRQADADARRGPVPPIVAEAAGPATLETFTILHDRRGAPAQGIVVARLEDGGRTMARVPLGDGAALDRLRDPRRTPVGARGHLTPAADAVNEWSFS